jgi:hypothetical protein
MQAKIFANFFSVIGEHLSVCVFFYAIRKAFKKIEYLLWLVFHFLKHPAILFPWVSWKKDRLLVISLAIIIASVILEI